jgi:hypothetical protein
MCSFGTVDLVLNQEVQVLWEIRGVSRIPPAPECLEGAGLVSAGGVVTIATGRAKI